MGRTALSADAAQDLRSEWSPEVDSMELADRLKAFQRTYPLPGDRVGWRGLVLSHGWGPERLNGAAIARSHSGAGPVLHRDRVART